MSMENMLNYKIMPDIIANDDDYDPDEGLIDICDYGDYNPNKEIT